MNVEHEKWCEARQNTIAETQPYTFLGPFYRRMRARLGAAKAITSAARKRAVIFYTMVTEGKAYHELGEVYSKKTHTGRGRLHDDTEESHLFSTHEIRGHERGVPTFRFFSSASSEYQPHHSRIFP